MAVVPEASPQRGDGLSQQARGQWLIGLAARFLDQLYGMCAGGSCWFQCAAVFQVPPKKVLAGRTVRTELLIWLSVCFLFMPCRAYGENDVWEQTDTQSPWVIPCTPSVLLCLLGWDANIMNFNCKRKVFLWKHVLRWGKYKLQNNSWTFFCS